MSNKEDILSINPSMFFAFLYYSVYHIFRKPTIENQQFLDRKNDIIPSYLRGCLCNFLDKGSIEISLTVPLVNGHWLWNMDVHCPLSFVYTLLSLYSFFFFSLYYSCWSGPRKISRKFFPKLNTFLKLSREFLITLILIKLKFSNPLQSDVIEHIYFWF